jgi:hypothetical protein
MKEAEKVAFSASFFWRHCQRFNDRPKVFMPVPYAGRLAFY